MCIKENVGSFLIQAVLPNFIIFIQIQMQRFAQKLGADLAKLSLDIRRPRPLYGSCFHPAVMKQLCTVYDEVEAVQPLLERTGIRLALENHTDCYASEFVILSY